MSGIGDLPLTDAGRAAVQRHRAALANGDLQEWRQAYPAMVGAVIDAYLRRQRQGQLAETMPDARPTGAGEGSRHISGEAIS